MLTASGVLGNHTPRRPKEGVERIERTFAVSATGIVTRQGQDPVGDLVAEGDRARPPKGGRPSALRNV